MGLRWVLVGLKISVWTNSMEHRFARTVLIRMIWIDDDEEVAAEMQEGI